MTVLDHFDPIAIAAVLNRPGAVVVLRTDTLYGLVARAADPAAVRRVYELKRRRPDKHLIVLINDRAQVFDPFPPAATELADDFWPGRVTIIAPAPHAPAHLLKSSNTIGYRLPAVAGLRELVALAGPLVAPSANLEGQPPAADIAAARDYFGDQVDMYVDSGRVADLTPSRIYEIMDDGEVIRRR